MNRKFFALIGILILLIAVLPASAIAAPLASEGEPDPAGRVDNRPDPLSDEQAERREMAGRSRSKTRVSG